MRGHRKTLHGSNSRKLHVRIYKYTYTCCNFTRARLGIRLQTHRVAYTYATLPTIWWLLSCLTNHFAWASPCNRSGYAHKYVYMYMHVLLPLFDFGLLSVTMQSALQREYSSLVALNSYGHPEDAIVKAYDQHTLAGLKWSLTKPLHKSFLKGQSLRSMTHLKLLLTLKSPNLVSRASQEHQPLINGNIRVLNGSHPEKYLAF